MIIKDKRKWKKGFSLNIPINKNKIKLFDFINIDKHLKLDKKLTRLVKLMGILLTILTLFILNCHFSYNIL